MVDISSVGAILAVVVLVVAVLLVAAQRLSAEVGVLFILVALALLL